MSNQSREGIEAIQAVVDRVSSYQESAPEGTVEHELDKALSEAGLEVTETDRAQLVAAIESSSESSGQVSVDDVLG